MKPATCNTQEKVKCLGADSAAGQSLAPQLKEQFSSLRTKLVLPASGLQTASSGSNFRCRNAALRFFQSLVAPYYKICEGPRNR